MAKAVVTSLDFVSKWSIINKIRIEREIAVFTPCRDIYILTLDEVENGSYVHVHRPRRDVHGAWAKLVLIPAKLTEKDSDSYHTFLAS